MIKRLDAAWSRWIDFHWFIGFNSDKSFYLSARTKCEGEVLFSSRIFFISKKRVFYVFGHGRIVCDHFLRMFGVYVVVARKEEFRKMPPQAFSRMKSSDSEEYESGYHNLKFRVHPIL